MINIAKKTSFLIFVVILWVFGFDLLAQNTLSKINKITFTPDKKIFISLDQQIEYKTYILKEPNRLVIELKNIDHEKINIMPYQPSYIDKVEYKRSNNKLVITIFLSEKHTLIKSFYDKKAKAINCLLETKKSSVNNDQIANLIDKNNIDQNDFSANKNPKINEVVKSSNLDSSVKYSIKKNSDSQKITKEDSNKSDQSEIINPAKKPIIVIDAGHGGKDPGAIGVFARTKEKNITLSYAKELAKNLINEKKYEVYLTRNDDYFITLKKRVIKSRRKKADLFISLHANSSSDYGVSGFSIYTLSEKSSDKQAELLAQKENQADILNDVDFSDASRDVVKTLIDLSQRESKNNSAKFTKFVINEIKNAKIEILQNTHRFAGFKVLTAPDMASVLIELGYLSNKREEQLLNNFKYRRLIAKSLTLAINQYFNN